MMPIIKKSYWILVVLGGLYIAFLASLSTPWLQRHALYAHKLHTAWWQDLNRPEQWGFLINQVRPFNISTSDGETLYAWHVLPLGTHARHEGSLLAEAVGPVEDFTHTTGFNLLASKNTRLVINFHGNAGTVAQGWRTDTYRALASGDTQNIHVLAFDYRGFGYSTGSPTEEGLIMDGIAAVRWALDVARIPPERIVLVGQSLGAAVAAAVTEHFAVHEKVEFSGLVLVAGFSDLPYLMTTYAILHAIPIFSPLRPYPRIHRFFSDRIVDTWRTFRRLGNFVKLSRKLNLMLVHARDDYDIPWKHSDALFYAAANATVESEAGMTAQQIDAMKEHVALGTSGWTNTWTAGTSHGTNKKIKQTILRYGGHNRIMTYPAVAKAVLDAFGSEG